MPHDIGRPHNIRANLVVELRRHCHPAIEDIHFLIGLKIRENQYDRKRKPYCQLVKSIIIRKWLISLFAVVIHNESIRFHVRRQFESRIALRGMWVTILHPGN